MDKNNNPALYYFHQGTNYESYRFFGVHPKDDGYVFRVWAPNALSVSIVGDFNNWNSENAPMHLLNEQGVWESFLSCVKEYDNYKYAIRTKDGRTLLKADPFAFHTETPPGNASKIFDISGYIWEDSQWEHRYVSNPYQSPMNIYERSSCP